MNFSEIISADRIRVGVDADSKKKALEEMAALLARGCEGLSAEDIRTSLSAREKLGSTGLGHGVAIPHGRIPGVSNSVGAFVRLARPVDYEAHDEQPVDLLFGLVVPPVASEQHLQHLAAIAELFSDEAKCEALRSAESAEAIHSIICGG